MNGAAASLTATVRGAGASVAALLVGAAIGAACYALGPLLTVAAVVGAGYVGLAVWRPAIALTLAPLLSPLESHQIPVAGIGALSPTETAFLVLAAAWGWRAMTGRPGVVLPSGRDWPIIVLLLALLPGVTMGATPAQIGKLLVMWSAFYLVHLAVQELEPRQLQWVFATFLIGASALAVGGIRDYIAAGGAHVLAGGDTYGRAANAISDPNYYGAFLQLAAVPAAALLVGGRGRWRLALLPLLLVSLLAIALSLSRGAIIGVVFALVIVALAWSRSRVASAVLIGALALGTPLGLNPLLHTRVSEVVSERLSTITTHSSDNKRLLLWSNAIDITYRHPVFGIGANRFQDEATRRGLTERGVPLENVHNVYLNLAAELGLVGLGAFLAWVVRIGADLRVTLRRRLRDTYALGVGVTAALAGYLVQALTVSQYRVEVIQATFFLLAGTAAALRRHADDGRPAEVRGDDAATAALAGAAHTRVDRSSTEGSTSFPVAGMSVGRSDRR